MSAHFFDFMTPPLLLLGRRFLWMAPYLIFIWGMGPNWKLISNIKPPLKKHSTISNPYRLMLTEVNQEISQFQSMINSYVLSQQKASLNFNFVYSLTKGLLSKKLQLLDNLILFKKLKLASILKETQPTWFHQPLIT